VRMCVRAPARVCARVRRRLCVYVFVSLDGTTEQTGARAGGGKGFGVFRFVFHCRNERNKRNTAPRSPLITPSRPFPRLVGCRGAVGGLGRVWWASRWRWYGLGGQVVDDRHAQSPSPLPTARPAQSTPRSWRSWGFFLLHSERHRTPQPCRCRHGMTLTNSTNKRLS
jgi:hypothetical protein